MELKLEVLHRCFELGDDLRSVSKETGYSSSSIYAWRRKYIEKGTAALMNPPEEHKRGVLPEGHPASSPVGEQPVIHTGRGCRCRWPEWISITAEAGLKRSMSKKGCSPDNSACEGFFGHLKTEMFYNRNWDDMSLEKFIQEVNEYMAWYRTDRIKLTLGGLSPINYRRRVGVAV